jgi:hypothetical protein
MIRYIIASCQSEEEITYDDVRDAVADNNHSHRFSSLRLKLRDEQKHIERPSTNRDIHSAVGKETLASPLCHSHLTSIEEGQRRHSYSGIPLHSAFPSNDPGLCLMKKLGVSKTINGSEILSEQD